MPKIVDHEAKRSDIAQAVEDIIYDEGILSLTMKDVARLLGCSPSVISHYFSNKLDMLIYTHKRVRRRAEQTLLEGLGAGQDAAACFEAILPTRAAQWRDWHMCFAFWGLAANATYVQKEWTEASSVAHQIFQDIIRHAQALHAIDPALDPVRLATEVQVIVNGIATLVTQSRAEWPRERQVDVFRSMFRRVVAAGG